MKFLKSSLVIAAVVLLISLVPIGHAIFPCISLLGKEKDRIFLVPENSGGFVCNHGTELECVSLLVKNDAS